MQRWYRQITDRNGNPVSGAQILVYTAGTSSLATLYDPSEQAVDPVGVIGNPIITAADGWAAFAAPNGQYAIRQEGNLIHTDWYVTLSDVIATTGAVWGSITGTLASQTDLNTALGLKAPSASPTFTGSATFSFLTNTRVPFAGAAGLLSDNANLTYTAGTGLKVADATVSSSSTTGALIVTGGMGVGGAVYCADRVSVNASGASVKPLDVGSLSGAEAIVRVFGANNTIRLFEYYTGSNIRWRFGIYGSNETGSDVGGDWSFKTYSDGGSLIDNPIIITRASGGKIELGQTSRPVSIAKTANAAEWIHGSASELLTIAAAATTDTTANLLPANAIIEAVVVRVTTVIPTAATFSVGDATTAARFATGVAVAATTTAVGLTHVDQTGAAGPKQTAAAKIRITPNAVPGAATGVVRITVFYRQFIAPQS